MLTGINRAKLTVFGLLAGLSLIIELVGDFKLDERTGIASQLPQTVGDYEGADVFYCQDSGCKAMNVQFTEQALSGTASCPVCGGEVDAVSRAEKKMLPKETQVFKRQYAKSGGEQVSVNVVISGRDRMSIHRPQNCLPGLGYRIGRTRTVPVQLASGRTLNLRVLDLEFGEGMNLQTYAYAYWYTDGRRETCLQPVMILWTVWDRVVFNRATRWSYLSMMIRRAPGSDGYMQSISEFAARFHPLIVTGLPPKA